MHNEYMDVFTTIGFFKGTFSLKVKDNVKPYQVPSRCIAHTLQEPFREELKMLQDQQILAPLGVDETAEWYNSFVKVHEPNSTVPYA